MHNIKGIFRRARRLSAAALSKVGAQSLVDQLAGWQTRDCVLRFDDATGDKVLVYTARHDKQVNIYIYASIWIIFLFHYMTEYFTNSNDINNDYLLCSPWIWVVRSSCSRLLIHARRAAAEQALISSSRGPGRRRERRCLRSAPMAVTRATRSHRWV